MGSRATSPITEAVTALAGRRPSSSSARPSSSLSYGTRFRLGIRVDRAGCGLYSAAEFRFYLRDGAKKGIVAVCVHSARHTGLRLTLYL